MVRRVPGPVQQPQEAARPDPLELLFLLEHMDLEEQGETTRVPRGWQAREQELGLDRRERGRSRGWSGRQGAKEGCRVKNCLQIVQAAS